MNSLHGINLQNDEVAVRGKTLTWRRSTGQLVLEGEALTRVFLSRKNATEWAAKHKAIVSPV